MLTETSKGESTNNDGRSFVTMKVAKEIHEEIERFAKTQSLSLREATDKIFFAKVAAATNDQILSEHDDGLTVFGLAAKHVVNLKALDALIKAARLRNIQTDTDLKRKRLEILDNPPQTEVVKTVERFACPSCDSFFETRNGVLAHFNTEHDAPQDKALGHVCPFCFTEKSFDSQGSLRTHILAYHKQEIAPAPRTDPKPAVNPPVSPIPPLTVEKVVEKEITKFACPCGAKFSTEPERWTHLAKCTWLSQYVAKNATGVLKA